MSMDMSQFHQTFFDESFEGLDAMETKLLELQPETAADDPEAVNAIFRAAHSIKGGAGTFGFMEVGGFTHLMETLLEELRALTRPWSSDIIEVLLRSVDCTRAMLEASQRGEDAAPDPEVENSLKAILSDEAPAAQVSAPAAASPAQAGQREFKIHFAPEPDVAQQGNDPLRILRALSALGDTKVEADLARLKPLIEHDPESCPLSWTIWLKTESSEADIRDVFAWVEDACELTIEDCTPAADKAEAVDESGGVPKAAAAKAAVAKDTKRDSGGSIRVSVEKLDALINLVGELVITQAMLQQRAAKLDPVEHESLLTGLGQLDRNTRHLQEAVMSTRMLPVDFVFSRFPRLVRDTANQMGKKVRLVTEGEGAELDKGVIEKIVDPLNHIVRNAIDHGIETPDDRAAAGKDEMATVRLSAWHQGGNIIIEVSDDGRGMSREKIIAKARKSGIDVPDSMPDSDVWNLVFMPGLSTAEKVTDISGRGVGMDVVKKNIGALGGAVDIDSTPGKGSRVTIRLPLTLAILDGMTVRVGEEILVLPLASVMESLQVKADEIRSVGGQKSLIKVRDEYVPVLGLGPFFGYTEEEESDNYLVVLVEDDRDKLALVISELVGQQQVVVKNLETHYRAVDGVAGATILGDGRVSLIVDVSGLIRAASETRKAAA
nr:chemotaxis protein CheA [Oceanococcus sp. HetDA_MAG_MS8]